MRDILIGIPANFLTLVLTFLVAWLFYVFAGRRRLMNFFGLREEKILRIFIGHVPQSGIPQGLVGFEESSEARNLEDLFKSFIPGLSEQPGFLKYLQIADIDVKVLPAKKSDPRVTLDQSSISVGLRTSNYASALIEDELRCPVHFNDPTGSIDGPGLPLVPRGSETKGVVVRICRDDRCFFYVAGITEPATAGAARYLLKNWRSMSKKYPDGVSFYFLVEVKNDSRQTVVSLADHELVVPKSEMR